MRFCAAGVVLLEPWMTDLITSKGVAAAHAVGLFRVVVVV